MRFIIQYQYQTKDKSRPFIELESLEISSLNGEFLAVPNLGDHVFMTRAGVFGVVESKLFSYYDDYCNINIILIESYQDYSTLTKHPQPA
ncbi:hypothetical protein ACFQAT_00160 [Undibacterium arcticum]|uniref:Uncharacterized protein n=1 Tax=Undibacterium arcticum TaxID=1762892 RepID=A0ABV7F8W1_9BURK